jgi:hypothetical protein
VPALYHFLLSNGIFEHWTVPKASQAVQYLWDSIVRKHGDLVYVLKFSEALAIECCPDICYTDLSSFEKPNVLSILKTYNIIETGKVVSQDVDQSGSRMFGSLDAFREAALVFL